MEGSHGQLSASPPTTRTPSHPSAVSVPAATPRDEVIIDCSERPLSPSLLCSEGVESHAPSPSSGGHHRRRTRQRTALTVGQHLYSVVTALESLQYEAASPPSLTTATCISAASPAPCSSERAAVCTQGERRGVVSGSGGGADTSDGRASSDTYTITDGAVAWLCGRLEFLWKSALLHSDTRGSSPFVVKHDTSEAMNSEIGKTKREEEEEEEAALLFAVKASPTPSDATAPRPPPLPSLPVGPESEGGHRGCSGRPMPDLTGGSTAVGCADGRDEERPRPSRRQHTHRDTTVRQEDDGDGDGRLQLARLRTRLLTRLLAFSALRQVRDERAAEHDSRKRARSGGCRSVMDASPQVPSQKEEEENEKKAAAAARDTTFVSAESEINSRLVQEWMWQRVASLPRDLGGHVPLAFPFPTNDVRTTNDGVGSHVGASTRFEGNLSHLLVEWCALELADATTSATSSTTTAAAAPAVGPTRLVAKETRALAEALKAMEATLIAAAGRERSGNATLPSLTGDHIPTHEGSEGTPIAATLFDSTQSPAVVAQSASASPVAGPQTPLPSGSTALVSTPFAASTAATAAAQESGPSSVVPSVATTAGRVLRLSITKPPIPPATENTATTRSREDEDAGVGAVLPPAVMHGSSSSSGTATAAGVEGAPAAAVESGAAPQPPRRFALQLFSSRSAHEPPRVRAAELPDDAAEASVTAESGVAAASLKKDQEKGESVSDVSRVDEVRRTLAHCGCLVTPCCHHHHEGHHDQQQQRTLERQLRWCRVAPFILYARRGTSLEADLRVVLRGLGFRVEKTAHRRAGTVKASQQTKRRMRREGRKRDSTDGESNSTAAHGATADGAAPAPSSIGNAEGKGMRLALSLTTPSRTPPCPLSRLPPLFATYAWVHYGALRSAWLAHVAEPQPACDGPERVCALSNAADNTYDVAAAAAASASSFLPWSSPPAALCSGPNSVAGVSTLFPCVALADHSVAAVLHDLLGTVAFSTGCGQDTVTSGSEGVLRCHRYHCPADLERRLYRYMCYPMAGVAAGVCGQGGLTLEEWRAYVKFRYGSRLRRGKPKSDPTANKGAVVAGGTPLSGAAVTPHEETLGSPRLPLTAAAAAAVVAQHRTQRPSPVYSAVMDVTAVLLLTELSQVCCAAVAQEAAVLEACVAAVSRSVEAKGDATRRAEGESVTLSLSDDQRIMSSWATLKRRCAESRLAHTLMCARCDTTAAITTSAAALSCVLSGVLESDPLLAVYAEQLAVGQEEDDGSLKESTLASSTQHPLLSLAGDDDHASALCTVMAPVSQPSPAATKDSPSPPASSKAQSNDSAASQAEALAARASSLWLTLISVLCVGESAVAQYVRRVLLLPPPMLYERSRQQVSKSARNTTTHSAGRSPPPPTAPQLPVLLASLAPFTRANMFESSLEDLFHEETSQHGRPAAPLCEPHAASAQHHHHQQQQRQQPQGQELIGRHECTTESAVSPADERDTRVGETARTGGEPFASRDKAEKEEGEAEERCRVALAAAVALRHPRVLLRQLDHLWRLRSTSLPPASSLSSLPLVAEHRASLAASQRLKKEPKDVTGGGEADETKRRATEEEDEEEERRRRDAFASRIGSMVECVHLSSYAGADVTTRTTPSTAGGGRGVEGTWPLSRLDSFFSSRGVCTAASAAVAPPLASKTETKKSSEEFAVPAVSLGIVDTPPTAAAPTVPHTAPPSDRTSTSIHAYNTTATAKAEEEQHLVQASPAPSRPRLQLTRASHAPPHPPTAEAGTAVPERNRESCSRVDKRARSPPVVPASLTCSSAGGAAAPHSDSRRGRADGGPSRQHLSPITMRRVEVGGGDASTGGKGGGVAIDAVTHSVASGPLPCLSGVTELRVRWHHTDTKQPLAVPTAAEEGQGQGQEEDAVLLLELVADTLWEALGHLFCHAPTAYVCPTRADGAPAATPATAAGEGGAADAQAGAVQLAARPSPLSLASAPLLPPLRAARRTLRLQLDPALVKVQRLWRSLQPLPASASVFDSAQRVVVLPLATTPSRPSSVLVVELPAAPASTSVTSKAPTPHPSPSTRQGSTFSPRGDAAFTSPTHADLRHYGTVTASVRSVLSMTLGYAVYRLLSRLWDLWAAALRAEGSGSDGDGDGGDNDRGTHASLLPSSSVPSAREEEKGETKATSGRGAAAAVVVSLAETPPAVQRWLLLQLRAMGEGVLHPLLRSLTVRSGVPQPRREPLPQREQQPQQSPASSAFARALLFNTSACALREGDEETAWLAYPPLTRVLLPSLLHRYDAALQPSSGRSAGGGAVHNADVPFASSCADCTAPADGKAVEDVSSSSSSNSRVDAQRTELAMEVREAWVRVRQSLLLAGVCV